ncbi:membrane-associated transporter protein-like [Branchiostoma floridae]|uniref:Membrane-associated transporter protein-like n=1 Tax=Branchiostoma floridae TaxID=7739 RepID=A0A9J7MEG5_BRAFL|nr:membrane-associated transporter protein-like [Branchiostoma floridae]XP_035699302.1 membrane-associated transporter protein-like [Branchiostoma floridae]XP_035699303.1 membrane-associated transporter protein-like [Branchiostoma floridae]
METEEQTPLLRRDSAASSASVPAVPRRPWRQLLMNGSILLGREFCYALEAALVLPVLMTIGMPRELYSIVWLIPPVFGFIFVPLIGSVSDHCRCRWGRRRPFILALGLTIILGFALFLNGDFLVKLIAGDVVSTSPKRADRETMRTAMLAVSMFGAMLFDFAADFIESPIKAYLLDNCVESDRRRGLDMQGVLSGLGGFLGYATGAIDWIKLGIPPGTEYHLIFGISCFVFCICLLLNLCSIREVPLDELRENNLENKGDCFGELCPKDGRREPAMQQGPSAVIAVDPKFGVMYMSDDPDVLPDVISCDDGLQKVLVTTVFGGGDQSDDGYGSIAHSEEGKSDTEEDSDNTQLAQRLSITAYLRSILRMPKELACLCVSNFLGWAAFLCVMLFFTDFMGRGVYRGNPSAALDSPDRNLYEQGVMIGCWGLTINAASCALYSMSLGRILDHVSYRTMYIFGYLAFASGIGSMAIIAQLTEARWEIIFLCPVMGIMYGTLNNIPYKLISRYHTSETYIRCGVDGSERRGMGIDCALVSSQNQLSQIVIGASLGSIVAAVGSVVSVTVCSSVLAFTACIAAALLVHYDVDSREEGQPDWEDVLSSM